MLRYRYQEFDNELIDQLNRDNERDTKLIDHLYLIKNILIILKIKLDNGMNLTELLPSDIIIYFEDHNISQLNDIIINQPAEIVNPNHKFHTEIYFKRAIEDIIESIESSKDLLIFNYGPNYVEKIITFVALKKIQYLKDIKGIFSELTKEYVDLYDKNCIRYYVNITSMDTKVEIISMIVKVNVKSKMQIHMDIHKHLQYVLLYFFNDIPELKFASILLHSFASEIFNSEVWFTCPLESMAYILEQFKIPYKTLPAGEFRETSDWYKNSKLCQISMLCPGGLQYFIKTADMKNIWRNDVTVIKENENTYITSEQTGGYWYNKYIKYKTKYLKLREYSYN